MAGTKIVDRIASLVNEDPKQEATILLSNGREIVGTVDTNGLNGVVQVYSKAEGLSWAIVVDEVVAIGTRA